MTRANRNLGILGGLVFLVSLVGLFFSTGCLSTRITSAVDLRRSLDSPTGRYTVECVQVPHPAPAWCQAAYSALQRLREAIQAAQAANGLPGGRAASRRQFEELDSAVQGVKIAFRLR